METVLNYTVLAGNTLSQIAYAISRSAGVSWKQIADNNPGLNPNRLTVGQVIEIPFNDGTTGCLCYTILSGDTLSAIATGLAKCQDMTVDLIVQNNTGLDSDVIQVGQVLAIPSTIEQKPASPLVDADIMGYWHWTYSSAANPPNATISIAFSGWADVDTALQEAARVENDLVGEKFVCIGGGGEGSGSFSVTVIDNIISALNDNRFAQYDGIAFDVEVGDSGLASHFSECFALTKSKGLKLLVTISHSAPYGINDAADLMSSFLADCNIDYLSPQLYTTGKETANDYDTSHGVSWSQFGQTNSLIVPSIVVGDYYADAINYFAQFGVKLAGYVQWSQSS